MYNTVDDINRQLDNVKADIDALSSSISILASIVAQSNVRLSKESIGDSNVGIAFDNAVVSLISLIRDLEDAHAKTKYRLLQMSDLYETDKVQTGFSSK